MGDTMKHIFLTDDDQDDCMLFSEALQEILPGCELSVASNGAQLMEMLEDKSVPVPDIIFLDLNMPLKNGFECLNALRSSHLYSEVPIVIYSTSSNMDVIEKTFEEGANFYICKPASFQALKGTIAKVLSLGPQQLREKPTRDHFIVSF